MDPEKKPAELLKEADVRLRSALDSVGEGAWDWNLRTGEVFFSDRWVEALGYARAEVLPTSEYWESLIHPDQLRLFREKLEGHARGLTTQFDCEYQLRSKSGDYRWTLDRGRIVEREDAGRALRMVGSSFDITHSKMAEYALDQAQNLCRSIVDTSGAVVLVLTSDYRIVEWNPAAERIYGWSRAEVRGQNYVEWFLPESAQAGVSGEIRRIIAGGDDAENFENAVITRDGSERLLLWNATRLIDSKGVAWAIVAIGQDITDRRRAEVERAIALREKDLALGKVRAFQGSPLICGFCKSVRSDDGSWKHLESYISEELGLTFGQGVCHSCRRSH